MILNAGGEFLLARRRVHAAHIDVERGRPRWSEARRWRKRLSFLNVRRYKSSSTSSVALPASAWALPREFVRGGAGGEQRDDLLLGQRRLAGEKDLRVLGAARDVHRNEIVADRARARQVQNRVERLVGRESDVAVGNFQPAEGQLVVRFSTRTLPSSSGVPPVPRTCRSTVAVPLARLPRT